MLRKKVKDKINFFKGFKGQIFDFKGHFKGYFKDLKDILKDTFYF